MKRAGIELSGSYASRHPVTGVGVTLPGVAVGVVVPVGSTVTVYKPAFPSPPLPASPKTWI